MTERQPAPVTIEIPAPTAGDMGLIAIKRSIRRCTVAAVAVIAVCFGGLGTWAALAPLESAVIANGVVIVDSRRKTVQHLEGGIIKELAVREGDAVRAGEVLVRLDDTQARASFQLLRGRYLSALAERARLVAERDSGDRIVLPPALEAVAARPKIAALIASQRRVFQSRKASLSGQLSIYDEQIRQSQEQIVGLRAQMTANARQLAIIEEELQVVADLFKKGFETKRRLLALQREAARLAGYTGAYTSRIAETGNEISRLRLQKIQIANKMRDEVVDELRKVEETIIDHQERLRAAADVLQRIDIRAPQAGVVVDLHFHTEGGVIRPSEPILDIVPQEDRLVIEAKIQPDDIESVRVGLPASVRLTAYSSRKTPMLDGDVSYVSADRFTEKSVMGEMAHYIAHIKIDPASLTSHPELKVAPGMSASVMIKTGAKTALDYAIDPIAFSLRRAFREQ